MTHNNNRGSLSEPLLFALMGYPDPTPEPNFSKNYFLARHHPKGSIALAKRTMGAARACRDILVTTKYVFCKNFEKRA
jgi:hypothetical protein